MELTLPASLSVYVNMYAVGSAPTYAVGAQAGDDYFATASGNTYTFDLESQTAGDWWCQLFIGGTGTGVYFPVRDDVAYPWTPWEVIEATVLATPTTPSPITGMCNLLVSTTGGAGSRVWAKLADTNNTADQVLVGQQVVEDTTDADGNATLVLIRYGQFTAGGTYRIRVANSSRVISNNVLVRMPDTASANLEDLTPL